MTTVGLTGQSGSGKTTVSKVFGESGFSVINADKIAAAVMEKDHPCLAETVNAFGKIILAPDLTLNRKKLAEIVFSDRKQLDRLNGITYPYINKTVLEMLNTYEKNCIEFVLLDAPTLFEAGEDKFCDAIVSVIADKQLLTKRIMQRDGISEEAAAKRLAGQNTEDFFRQHSDYIIINNGTPEMLLLRTKEVIKEITEKFRQ